MHAILSLLSWIFCGDFGLLTMTPRYLFGVLFPVMVFVGFLAEFLYRLQPYQKAGSFLPLVVGLGCTTAAVASLDSLAAGYAGCSSRDNKDASTGIKASLRQRTVWLLILLIPCSSQIAIIASFAALVTLRVFLAYLGLVVLFAAVIWLTLRRVYPSTPTSLHPMPKQQSRTAVKPFVIVKEAFLSVTSTIPSFCIGSVFISVLSYCGVMDGISEIFAPWLKTALHLPKEAASLFILNLFKRDFGSASLLHFAESGAFDACQLVTVMVMLTFCVPCFNTTVLLYKQEKLPMATLLWLGSLFVCLLLGRLVSTILFVCTF